MAHIRPYQTSDEKSMLHIFRETATPHLRSHPDPLVLHYGSFIWLRPYIHLHPEHCFVIDNGQGEAVGYILCTPNTTEYVKTLQHEYVPMITQTAKYNVPAESKAETKADPNVDADLTLATKFLHTIHHPELTIQDSPDSLLTTYPAHLHIDILPTHQRQAWGPRLMDTLLDKLRTQNVPGIHLYMDRKNHAAGRFYERIGFRRWDGVLDGGKCGRIGEGENGVLFVRKIE